MLYNYPLKAVGGSTVPDEEGKDYSWVMGLSMLVGGNTRLQELAVRTTHT